MDFTVIVRVKAPDLGGLVDRIDSWQLHDGEFVQSLSATPGAATVPVLGGPIPPPEPAA